MNFENFSFKNFGCPMYVLDRKLKLLKTRLKEWNKNSFGDVKIKVTSAENELANVQEDIIKNGNSDSLQDKEAKAQHDMEVALNMEEDFWREKSRVNWQIHGDRNTKFFHTYAKIRRKTSLISSLVIDNDVITNQNTLENHIVSHFTQLFNKNFVPQDNDLISTVIPSLVSEQANMLLTMIPSADEIHQAVQNLKPNSASGPDGFGGVFFHKYWDIIKHDVIEAVLQFFTQGWISPNYNANTLVLIPKAKEASSLGHYRPIALANFKFKIIPKILADRLSSILPNLISVEQKALKIDIAKAFDTLSWDFLLKTLKGFGFSSLFCNWIHTIITSVNISISFNGNQIGYLKCTNGAIADLLKEYGNCYGQLCNFSKSLIYAGGLSQTRYAALANLIGFTMASPPFIYLGVPIFIGKPKAIYFLPIADSIRVKLASWKAEILTIAGRAQLVKSVILSMVVHSIGIYNWPGSIIKRIEAWLRNFIWSGCINKKKVVTISWKTCCRKTNEGGLGIISLKAFNSATNMQLFWKILNVNQHWSILLNGRVKRNGRLIRYAIKSSIWSGIKEAHERVKDNCMWSIVRDWWKNTWQIKDNIQVALPEFLSSISNFSVATTDVDDLLAWKHSSSCVLTVKEAYNSIITPYPSTDWKTFPWDKDSPPSQSMMVWRYIHNKLPTDDNLLLRGFSFPSQCSFCKVCWETSSRIFFGCSFVISMWNCLINMMGLNRLITNVNDCKEVLNGCWSLQARAVIHACIVGVFHQIWHARNKLRFDDKTISWNTCVNVILAQAKVIGNNTIRVPDATISSFSLLKRFDININPSKGVKTMKVLWSPPSLGWIKCNIDGAVIENPKVVVCGGIFRDHNANHILSFSAYLDNNNSESTELIAAIMAIEAAKKNHYTKFWVETDCSLVVNSFKNHALVPWKLRSRWLCCWDYTLHIEFSITLNFREANFYDDSLASIGLQTKNYLLVQLCP
ncbi:uncharacterized protein LOC131658278 [Vicia villosa]|uniref:uncharacterized protein LOC131658278 n=1 Tax=Vicia villosa TaxID=3911 RepID=UPI00273B8E2B|nr:uncharacterized protein LOC131658278 [Vicia villosa]